MGRIAGEAQGDVAGRAADRRLAHQAHLLRQDGRSQNDESQGGGDDPHGSLIR